MNHFEHEFDRVEDYLHHRRPYLLVDKINSISKKEIRTSKALLKEDFFVQGHFPGAPIFPGALMQELTTQSAGILIAAKYNPMKDYQTKDPFFNEYALGVLVKVHHARYLGFARPGQQLEVTVELEESINSVFDFNSRIIIEDELIMRNSFRLANIKSSVLQGIG